MFGVEQLFFLHAYIKGDDAGFLKVYDVKSDGTAWARGLNYSGQLGNGTSINANIPVQVSGLAGIEITYSSPGRSVFCNRKSKFYLIYFLKIKEVEITRVTVITIKIEKDIILPPKRAELE